MLLRFEHDHFAGIIDEFVFDDESVFIENQVRLDGAFVGPADSFEHGPVRPSVEFHRAQFVGPEYPRVPGPALEMPRTGRQAGCGFHSGGETFVQFVFAVLARIAFGNLSLDRLRFSAFHNFADFNFADFDGKAPTVSRRKDLAIRPTLPLALAPGLGGVARLAQALMVRVPVEKLPVAAMRNDVIDGERAGALSLSLTLFAQRMIPSARGTLDLSDEPGAVLLPGRVIAPPRGTAALNVVACSLVFRVAARLEVGTAWMRTSAAGKVHPPALRVKLRTIAWTRRACLRDL